MKLEPFNRQINVFLKDLRDPRKKSERLATVAREGIAEIRQQNSAAIGRDAPPQVFVDGREGAPLESVRPDGVIVANFNPLRAVLEWIGEQLLLESPRLTGRYQRSHIMLADGVEVPMDGTIPQAEIYRFLNTQPYARKMEPRTTTISRRDRSGPIGTRRRWSKTFRTGAGQSPQAPDGVYAAISAVAATRFGNIARIEYRTNWFDETTKLSHPSIVVIPF